MAEDAVGSGTDGATATEGVEPGDPATESADAETGTSSTESVGDETSTPSTESTGSEEDAYGGLPGAFPYALRSSDSWLFTSYVVLGGLVALGTALLFGLALVVLLGNTVSAGSGTFSFVRAFFIFVGLLVVAPLIAPILAVARRHRRGRPDRRFDASMAGLGYLFVGSLYLAGVISTPAGQQQLPAGALEPVVAVLYALPRLAGLVPPVLVALAMLVVARRWE